jgi:hypothetical protein
MTGLVQEHEEAEHRPAEEEVKREVRNAECLDVHESGEGHTEEGELAENREEAVGVLRLEEPFLLQISCERAVVLEDHLSAPVPASALRGAS